MAKSTKKRKLKQTDGAKQQHKKQKLDRVSSESSKNDESLNSESEQSSVVDEKPKGLIVESLNLPINVNEMLSPFTFCRNSDESTLYCWVNHEKLEAARIVNDNNALMKSVLGFGMVYSMTLNERVSKYLKEMPLLKNDKYQMMPILTLKKTDPELFGLDFSCAVFVLEIAAHCLKKRCNRKFFTRPGLHDSATFVNRKYVNFLEENQSIVDFTADLILKALREHDYVKEFVCEECGLMMTNDAGAISRHSKKCAVVRVRALLKQEFEDKKQEQTKHEKDAKFWCRRCGSGFTADRTRCEHVERKHSGACIFHCAYELLMVREISASANNKITFDQVLNVADNLGGASVTMTRKELVIDMLSNRVERELERNSANGRAASKELVLYTVDGKGPIEIIKDITSGEIEISEE